jgi:hypothetical protein
MEEIKGEGMMYKGRTRRVRNRRDGHVTAVLSANQNPSYSRDTNRSRRRNGSRDREQDNFQLESFAGFA